MDIWQTTNQEPWVSALVDGAIGFKTRTSRPVVPVGSPVLIHASTKLWPDWEHLYNSVMAPYVDNIDTLKANRGMVLGVGIISEVGVTIDFHNEDELEAWKVTWGNCAADFCWACDPIVKLNTPVKARGFQAPFARAKQETIEAIIKANPDVRKLLETA